LPKLDDNLPPALDRLPEGVIKYSTSSMNAMMPPVLRYRVRCPPFIAPFFRSFIKPFAGPERRRECRSGFSWGSSMVSITLRGRETEMRRRGPAKGM
jgi:hypothetical protein